MPRPEAVGQAPRAAGPRRWRWPVLSLLGALLGAGLIGPRSGPGRARPATAALGARRSAAGTPSQDPAAAADAPGRVPAARARPGGEPTASPSLGARALGQERLRRAEDRLAAYRRWARYPPDSRPASEHPDRLQPAAPLIRVLPLSPQARRGPGPEVRLQLVQERVTLVGSESARLSVRCADAQGALLPCQVLTASAQPRGATGPAPPRPPVTVRFGDDGRSGDEAAGDGTLSAMLQPARLGFGGYLGPLRVALTLRAGPPAHAGGPARGPAGDEAAAVGETSFDLWYTPEPPAVLTGQVREAVSDGSLHLYLGIDVRLAGRYFLAARVDDARGKSFALLERSAELSPGVQEVGLTVFGKLIRDAAPAMPLRLRDVDGFLLKEAPAAEADSSLDAEPEREYLPLVAGYIHTTDSYPPAAFSASDWRGAERDSEEAQLLAEIDAVRRALAQLDRAAIGAADALPPAAPQSPGTAAQPDSETSP